ncbi:hypothetical protein ACIHFD_35355 [Nonomuraea sp. NPDC051941]|uniref:hypothetical protein n=1 Tax=Nonomuraea sp. NPDC051941 TaxID=3364373 RepID=UPI0037C727B5
MTSVVFPLPWSPTSATVAPAGSRRSMPRSTGGPPYEKSTPDRVMPSRRRSGGASAPLVLASCSSRSQR